MATSISGALEDYLETIFLLIRDKKVARVKISSRHQMLVYLFQDILRLPPDRAEIDACGMEHSLSSEGLDYLARFVEFTKNDAQGVQLIPAFRRYLTETTKTKPSKGPGGDPIWVRLHGARVALRRKEADAVLVVPL